MPKMAGFQKSAINFVIVTHFENKTNKSKNAVPLITSMLTYLQAVLWF